MGSEPDFYALGNDWADCGDGEDLADLLRILYEAGRAAERERVRPVVEVADRTVRALTGRPDLVLSGDTGRVIWAMGAVTDLGHALTAYLAAESEEDADV